MYFYKSQSGAGGSSHEYWWAHLWLSSAVFAQCQCQPLQNPSSSSSANWSPLSTLSTLITLTTFITLMNLTTIAMPWWPSSHGIILSTSPYMQWATLEPPEVPPTAIQGPMLRCHSRSLGTNFRTTFGSLYYRPLWPKRATRHHITIQSMRFDW